MYPGSPVCSRPERIRIAKSNMDSWNFLVLEEAACQVFDGGICADRKFSDPFSILAEVQSHSFNSELVLKFHVYFDNITIFDCKNNWLIQNSVFRREVISQHIRDDDAIHSRGTCVHLSLREVSPITFMMMISY